MHDPVVYPDPAEFRPERFMRDGHIDETVRDPFKIVFGSGRRCVGTFTSGGLLFRGVFHHRICPGRYFATDSLFLIIASVLHMFDITPPMNDDGQPIRVEPRMSDGFLSYVIYLAMTRVSSHQMRLVDIWKILVAASSPDYQSWR